MKVNVHMLMEDLSDLCIHRTFADHWSTRPIRFAAHSEGIGPLKDDRLYVMSSLHATSALAATKERANVLCIGGDPAIPNDISCRHNLAWTAKNLSIAGVVERLNDRIAYYNDWQDRIDDLFAENAPFRRIAEATEELFGNPIWMWDSQLQTVFHVMTEDRYIIPPNYQRYAESEPWPISGANAINDTFKELREACWPYILPPMFGYSSLCYNLRENGHYRATLSVDQISGKAFTDRERVIIQYLGQRMEEGLKYQTHFSKHALFSVNAQIEKLLAGGNVPHGRLAASLGKKGWSIDDTYFCIVAQQKRESSYSEVLMAPLAEKVCDASPGTMSILTDASMLFITNFSVSGIHPRLICDNLTTELERTEMLMRVGVSTPFSDFTTLPYFRDQAEEAIYLGKRSNPGETVSYFHDHIMEAIVRRCMRDTIPEVLRPPSLSRLMRYDKSHNGDLVKTLETYLANDMSANKTAQSLFMHRNTLLARLKKIEEVGQLNLEDTETRLLLDLSLRLTS